MSRQTPPKPREHHRAPLKEAPLDFNPRQQLSRVLKGRPVLEGVSFDPPGSYILDDGIVHIKKHGEGWHVTSVVADVPAMIPPESELRRIAAQRMEETHIRGKGIVRIFPVNFLEQFVSLRQGATRAALSFSMFLDEKFSLQHYKIGRAGFLSKEEHSEDRLEITKALPEKFIHDWKYVSRGLYQKRVRDLAGQYDSELSTDVPEILSRRQKDFKGMTEGKLLVHEVTRLTNRVAADFFRAHNLLVPFREQKSAIAATLVTPYYAFDRACNKMCADMVNHLEAQRPAYVHLTSPMRHYKDFLVLEVLGKALVGQDVDPALRRDIYDLTANFNKHSCMRQRHLLEDQWRSDWGQQLRDQEAWTPFMNVLASRKDISPAARLKILCADRGWETPMVAERELMVQGTSFYFIGLNMRLHPGQGPDLHIWSYGPSPEAALEYASHRLLKKLQDVPERRASITVPTPQAS